MGGYGEEQLCMHDTIEKCLTSSFENEVYKALGLQGGTIHQVIKEIERLKNIESCHMGHALREMKNLNQ